MKRLLLLLVLILGTGLSTASTTNTIELTKTNFISLKDEVNFTSVDAVLNAVYKSDSTKEFYIAIDSPGGSVFAGLRLVRFLQTTDRQITCIASTAISMAFIVLQACPKRVVIDSAVLMAHGIAADLGHTNIASLKNGLKILQGLEDMINTLVANRLKLSVDDFIAKLNPEYWLIGGTVITINNAADSVANIKCSKEVELATEKFTFQTPFGLGESVRPLCPF